jgi:sulfur-oxidizing protein SoxX
VGKGGCRVLDVVHRVARLCPRVPSLRDRRSSNFAAWAKSCAHCFHAARSRQAILPTLHLGVALACAISHAAVIASLAYGAQPEDTLRSYRVVGDAIPDSLTGAKGEAERGRSIVLNRQMGLCLLCHSGPYPEEKFQGTLAPDLKGTGSRWSEGQLRLRMVDASRLYPDTIMPPYYRVDGLVRVAPAFAGKPILTAEQIEDVVAYLVTLRDESKR